MTAIMRSIPRKQRFAVTSWKSDTNATLVLSSTRRRRMLPKVDQKLR